MRKSAFCICENKGRDQLRSNCAADNHLCFSYIDSTVVRLADYLLLVLFSVAVHTVLCRTKSETKTNRNFLDLAHIMVSVDIGNLFGLFQ